ncbi:MAG: chromate transporter [Anaerolineae bacterium]
MVTATGGPPPRLMEILTTWFIIGLQSFGGGSTTLYLIHQACIARGWLSEAEFARAWALVQISPGINLLKLTGVIGFQLRGWPGLMAALAGLLLPSAAITVLMTAGFAALRDLPAMKAAMRGIAPATVGLSLGLAVQMAQSPLARARREGRSSVALHLALLGGAALLFIAAHASPVLILLLTGLMAALGLGNLPARWIGRLRKDAHAGRDAATEKTLISEAQRSASLSAFLRVLRASAVICKRLHR